MQALTSIAAQLLQKNWSIMEDLFRDAAATVHHFKKRSQACNSANSKLIFFSAIWIVAHLIRTPIMI
jgi:hypothetical protein